MLAFTTKSRGSLALRVDMAITDLGRGTGLRDAIALPLRARDLSSIRIDCEVSLAKKKSLSLRHTCRSNFLGLSCRLSRQQVLCPLHGREI